MGISISKLRGSQSWINYTSKSSCTYDGKMSMWATLLGSEGNTGSASLAFYEEGTCTIWPIQAMAVIIKDPSIEDPVCKAIERNLGYTFYGHTFYLK